MSEVMIDATRLAKLSAAAKHDEQIIDMERVVTNLKAKWDQAKDSSLAAKKAYDQAVNELRELISNGPSDQVGLFDGVVDMVTPSLKIASIAEESEDVDAESGEDPLLRSIDCLNVPQAMKDKLREVGVFNVGQANEFRLGKVTGFDKGAASIPGWGDGKIKKFEKALLAVLPEQSESEDLGDEVDTVEAVSSDATEDPASDESPTRRIRLTQDVAGMEDVGMVYGAEFEAKVSSDNIVTIDVDDAPYILEAGEFEYVASLTAAV